MRVSKAFLVAGVCVVSGCGGGGGGAAGPVDSTAPVVLITAPANGATVTGVAAITADATDDVGVARVDFYLNGIKQGSDTSAPYSYSWDTSTLARGTYSWSAKAYDAAGNERVSAPVAVTVPVYVSMSTTVSGAGAVGTVSLAGLPVAAPYGLNFAVTMPAGATLAGVVASGPYAGSGLASTSGANTIILASSNIASGQIMTVNFANVGAGVQPSDFAIALTAVFDGGGTQIQ